MKTIGLIGGSTWLSTSEYYRILNQYTNEKRGGNDFARLILYSINFGEFNKMIKAGDRPAIRRMFIEIAKNLENSGAGCLMLCANTMHMFADDVAAQINIPLIHIVDETAKAITNSGMKKVGLLGTKLTMEEPFYRERLLTHGIEIVIPGEEDRKFINDSIFYEFTKDIFSDETRSRYIEIIGKVEREGAEGIILGCTEIPLLIKQNDCKIRLFDTTMIHAKAAVEFAVNN
jgi:aspartate racemase